MIFPMLGGETFSKNNNMRKKVIAIFEDDPINKFVYERTLQRREDVEVKVFSHPEDGIEAAKEIHFDIVFIELHFRGPFEGLSIIEALKKVCSEDTVFIAMTSFLQRDDLEKALDAGFSACLEKPVVFSAIDFSRIK